MTRLEWREQAACRGAGIDMFDNERAAKQLCATCPVTHRCAEEYADEPHGIVFGTTPEERGFGFRRTKKGPKVSTLERVRALLESDTDRRWSANQVADRLHVSPSGSAQALRTLGDQGDARRHLNCNRATWSAE